MHERFPWIAAGISLVLHGAVVLVLAARGGERQEEAGGDAPFVIDVEVAPEPPKAEALPPELLAQELVQRDEVPMRLEPEPEPAKPEPAPERPEPAEIALDAGVPDAAPPGEPRDAGQVIAEAQLDEQPMEQPPPGDAGVVAAETTPVPVSAGTAANLHPYFPKGHILTILLRFDRLRGTEWARVAQDVLGVMPDFTTLVADPDTAIADELDLMAVSTALPNDVGSSLVAMKSAITPGEMRDLLDEPGAPVDWSRVTGGVLGTRKPGKRVVDGDKRVFLQPYDRWTVLAKKKDLKGMLDPVEGALDAARADAALMPDWLSRLSDIETESGIPDGPALMLTSSPRKKTWKLPDVGLEITEVKAPDRLTLSLEIDEHGWVIKGNLKFATEADAQAFLEQAEAARDGALASTVIKTALKRANAYNAVKGLTLARTDRRVSYATSVSIADARAISAVGTLLVAEYFRELEEAAAEK